MKIQKKVSITIFCLFFLLSGLNSSTRFFTKANPSIKENVSTLLYGEFTWTEPFIKEAFEFKIFDSEENDPLRPVYRDEFIAWLVRAKGDSLVETNNPFTDVEPANQYFSYIMTALSKGYITKDSQFYPRKYLNRTQMGIWMINAMGSEAIRKAEPYAEEPCILAQDGYEEIKTISKEAAGKLTLCYQTEYQLLSYRQEDCFRVVKPLDTAIVGEAAYGLIHIKKPPQKTRSITIEVPLHFDGLLAWEPFSFQSVVDEMVFINQGSSQYKDQTGTYPIILKRIPTIQNGLLHTEKRGDKVVTLATLELRKNLRWSNGDPIKAEDITLGFYFYKHPAFQDILSNGIDSMVEKAESIDPWTVVVTYSEAYIYAGEYVPSLPRKYLEGRFRYHLEAYDLNDPNYYNPETGEKSERYLHDEEFINSVKLSEYNKYPIHGGAYSVYRWDQPDKIFLKANTYYLSGTPLIDTITINLNSEEITDLDTLLKKGSSDLYLNIPSFNELIQCIDQQSEPSNRLQIISASNEVWEHIELNIDNKILKDQNVREALQLSIDRSYLNQKNSKGLYSVSKAIFKYPSYSYQYFTPREFECDLEIANQKMIKAGWSKNGDGFWEKENKVFEITFITVSKNSFREAVQADIAKMWTDFGIQVVIQNTDYNDLFKRIMLGREFDGPTAVMFAWIMSPLSDLYSLFHSSQIPQEQNNYEGQNYTGYSDKLVDTLLTENKNSMDIVKIHKNVARIAKKISYDTPMIPLFYRSNSVIAKKNLSNIIPVNSSDIPVTWNCAYWYLQE